MMKIVKCVLAGVLVVGVTAGCNEQAATGGGGTSPGSGTPPGSAQTAGGGGGY
jgi:hypothetical protein